MAARPEDVIGALASFPPRLSVLARLAAMPEEYFESSVKTAMGFELPPGPMKMASSLMESFEASLSTAAPTFAPPAPLAPAQPRTVSESAAPPTEAPRRRFEIL